MNFAEACRALAPSLDRAKVPWQDGQQGDNWDRIAEPLFTTLVAEPCAFQAVGEAGAGKLRVVPYGFSPSADVDAWFTAGPSDADHVIDLASVHRPFDHVRCGETGKLVPIVEAQFAFVHRVGGGHLHRVATVDLEAE